MDNNIISFSNGIDPGGLRTVDEVKLLILFLISKFNNTLNKDQVIEIVSISGITNYFILVSAFESIIKDRLIDISEDNFLRIDSNNNRDIELIENEIPFSVRQKIVNITAGYLLKLKREKENSVKISEVHNGYNIEISFLDDKDEIMKIVLYVADYEQAHSVKEKFLSDPVKIYSNIVSLLMT